MEKRAFERMPVTIECHCCNTEYFGTLVDLSEKGMFIRSQKIRFPLESEFDILIPLNEDMLNVRVKVNRLIKSNDYYYDGMGVELLNPPTKYLEFLINLNLGSQS
jgi:hypothetical protein